MVRAILVLALVPLIAFAQEDELRAQIRADLQSDPRSAQMSQGEFDSLVEALAVQAEEEGTASTYLAGDSSFDYSAAFAEEAAQQTTPSRAPLILAVLALLLALAGVVWYILHPRKSVPLDLTA